MSQNTQSSRPYLSVNVEDFQVTEEKSFIGSSYYTNFVIELTFGTFSWKVLRRYREFYQLHEKLQRKFPDVQFPVFPSRYEDNSDPEVLESRTRSFDRYLKEITSNYEILSSPEIQIFLELHECPENIFENPSNAPDTIIPLVNRELGMRYPHYTGYSETLKVIFDLHHLHMQRLSAKGRWQTKSSPGTEREETSLLAESKEREETETEIEKEEGLFTHLLNCFRQYPSACFFYLPQICNVLVYPWQTSHAEDLVILFSSSSNHFAVFIYIYLSHIIRREKEKRDKGIVEQPKPLSRSLFASASDGSLIGAFEAMITDAVRKYSSSSSLPSPTPTPQSFSTSNKRNLNSSDSTIPLPASEEELLQRGKIKLSGMYFQAKRLCLVVESSLVLEKEQTENEKEYVGRVRAHVVQRVTSADDERTRRLEDFEQEHRENEGRSKVLHDSLFFLSSLVNAGEKLFSLPRIDNLRFEILKEQMQSINESILPSNICIPTFLNIGTVLQIPNSEFDIDLLRSKERAPYLIRVEYLKNQTPPYSSFESLVPLDTISNSSPSLISPYQGGAEGDLSFSGGDNNEDDRRLSEDERQLILGTPPNRRKDHVALHSVISNNGNPTQTQSGSRDNSLFLSNNTPDFVGQPNRPYGSPPNSNTTSTTTLLAATRNPTLRDATTVITSAAMPMIGETWDECYERLKSESEHKNDPLWGLIPLIVKSKEDVFQEQFAMQLIYEFLRIWRVHQLPLRVRPYRVLGSIASNVVGGTSAGSWSGGIVEAVPNAYSLHAIKKNTSGSATLLEFFSERCGGLDTPQFFDVQQNFVESTAAYSIISYFLQVKDRHNGNILICDNGDILHIDYRKFLTNYPGTIPVEFAPFKLTDEMIEMMDGLHSNLWNYYCRLCVLGFRHIQQNIDQLTQIVEIMRHGEIFDCFSKSKFSVEELRDRARTDLDGKQTATYVLGLIGHALDSSSTTVYDLFQYVTNGIM